jgi:very-short-patch-repair endonuclease
MDRRSARRYRDAERLAGLLDRQHLVVSSRQIAECGYSKWAVSRAVAVMEFHWIHRGVLCVARRPPTFKGHCMAAALACGPDAVVSHHAAMALWDLRPVPQAVLDVTAPVKRTHRGVRSHASPVSEQHRTYVDAIPITTLERTYLDYAEQATPRQLQNALEAGERRGILDLRKLQLVMHDSPGRRGLKPLNAALEEFDGDPGWTQSDLERALLELIGSTDLPRPRTNILIEGELVDCAWPTHKLIVEVDSYRYHKTRRSFESDRARDAKLQKAGWRVLRITDRRLFNDPAGVLADVRAMLTQ